MVERRLCKPKVSGSSPLLSTSRGAPQFLPFSPQPSYPQAPHQQQRHHHQGVVIEGPGPVPMQGMIGGPCEPTPRTVYLKQKSGRTLKRPFFDPPGRQSPEDQRSQQNPHPHHTPEKPEHLTKVKRGSLISGSPSSSTLEMLLTCLPGL